MNGTALLYSHLPVSEVPPKEASMGRRWRGGERVELGKFWVGTAQKGMRPA